MSRPPSDKSRTRQVNLLLSKDEHKKLGELAEERGLTVSDVLRLLIRREAEVSPYLTAFERDAALGQAHMDARARKSQHR